MKDLGPLLISALVMVACVEGTPPSREAYVVRDSAGVEIVESFAPTWTEGQNWQVDSVPFLDIGVAEGDPEYELGRVPDAMTLLNGNIVVVDLAANQLRFFDSTGTAIRRVGREGEGPGEFKFAGGLDLLDSDSVVVFDYQLMRASVFDTAGHFVSSFTFTEGPIGNAWPVGVFRNHSILALKSAGWGMDGPPGFRRTSQQYLRIDLADLTATTLASGYSAESVRLERGVRSAVFGRSSAQFVSDSSFYYGFSAEYQITEVSISGDPIRIFRRNFEPVPVTAGDKERFQDSHQSQIGIDRSDIFADHFPTFSSIVVDRRDYLWVENYRAFNEGPYVWTVFSPDGYMRGDLTAPDGLRIYEIGDDYILGQWDDEVGAEHVRKYRLHRQD